MKRNILFAFIASATLTLSSCGFGTTGTSATNTTSAGTTNGDILTNVLGGIAGNNTGSTVATAGSSILNDLLGSLLSKTITEKSFVGTWTYQTPEVRFESENLLAQAGGSVIASSIETKLDTYLSKVGITKGVTTFTFNSDKSYTIQTKGKTISAGTYSYDSSSQTLVMQGTFGLLNQNCIVGMDGTNLCLMYDADKLLSVMTSAANVLGKASNTLGSVASVFGNNYKGMKVGFSLGK